MAELERQVRLLNRRTEIRPDVFVVYGGEKALGATVVQMQHFERGKVWTHITTADGSFMNMAGNLTPVA